MGRRRRFLDRPHDHLREAAVAHAAVPADALAAIGEGGAQVIEPEPSPQSQRASAQIRNDEGKFA